MIKHYLKSITFIGGLFMVSTVSSYGQEVPSYKIDNITIKPYASNQLDYGGLLQSPGDNPGPSGRATRLREGVRVNFFNQFEVGAIWDFGKVPRPTSGRTMALYEGQISYKGTKHFIATIGVFQPSFGLETGQSQRDVAFLERSNISTVAYQMFAGVERKAVQVETFGKRYHFAVAGTAGSTMQEHMNSQRAISFHASGTPFETKDVALRLGISGAWIFHSGYHVNGRTGFNFSNAPEIDQGSIPKYLNTGLITANHLGVLGAEASVQWKKLHVQGEAYDYQFSRSHSHGGWDYANFYGWYGMMAYTIHGDKRRWRPDKGMYSSPTCHKKEAFMCDGYGILEIAGRYSDLNMKSTNIHSGRERIGTIALNWWPTNILRTAIEYQRGEVSYKNRTRPLEGIFTMLEIKY